MRMPLLAYQWERDLANGAITDQCEGLLQFLVASRSGVVHGAYLTHERSTPWIALRARPSIAGDAH